MWMNRIVRVGWNSMGTATTKYPYTKEGIEKAQDKIEKLFRAMHRRYGSFNFTRILVPANGKVHFHFAYQGPRLNEKELRKFWKRRTGCHQFKIKPWNNAHFFYLIFKNLALSSLCEDFSFRRVVATIGLFPEYRQRRSSEHPWVDVNLQDVEELRAYIKTADENTLRESLDRIDRCKELPSWVIPRLNRQDRLMQMLLNSPWLNNLLKNKNPLGPKAVEGFQ